MKLAMRLPARTRANDQAEDPRSGSAEIVDLASRVSYPVVAARKGRSDAVGLAAGIGFVAVLGAATLWGLNASRLDDDAGRTRDDAAPAAPGSAIAAPIPVATPAASPTPVAAPVPAVQPGMAPQAVLAAVPAANPFSSATLVFDGSAPIAQIAPPAAAAASPAPASPAPGGGNASEFASRVGGVGGGPAVARNDIDPKNTVTQGTMIPAVLETAINTDVPGYVRALVNQDVRSFDGTRVLIPRSSRLIGQYQSGLQAGQKRAYVIWTRLIRPDGVSVAIASPGSAFDGSGGIPGKVDTHFFSRFGSAMLLSVIGGLSAVGSSGTAVILGGSQSAASTALQQNGQIGPTIRVRPGEPIRVVTARDLDFSQAPSL